MPHRYKWDCIRSVVKSMAGLQKGKVAELEGRGGGGAHTRLLQPLQHQLQHGLDLLRHQPAAVAAAVSGAASRGPATGGGAGGLWGSARTGGITAPPGQLKRKGKGFLKLFAQGSSRSGGPGSLGSSDAGGPVDAAALAELLARAEVERERAAKMALLLGAVPQPSQHAGSTSRMQRR